MAKFISERAMNILTVFGMVALTLLVVMYHEQIFRSLVLEQIIALVNQLTSNTN